MSSTSLRYQCMNCHKAFRVNDTHLGKRVQCPGCQAVLLLPTAEELAQLGLSVPGSNDDLEELDAVALAESPDRPYREGFSWKKLLLGPDGTNVNLAASATLALALTAAFYLLVVWPLNNARTYFGELFAERGWVQYASTFLAFWAGVILLWKSYLLRRQRHALRLPVLPSSPQKITPNNVETFLTHVRSLARTVGATFLLRRVWRALEHFRVTGNRQDMVAQLETQSQVDATTAAGSYTLVKVCLGAIPILGFIGTCIGIAQAVTAFSGTMEKASDLKELKGSLGQVTSGLGVAFDTTLLALGLSLIILFAANGLEKKEEAVLNAIEEYCSEKVVRRLQDNPAGTDTDQSLASVDQSLQKALVPYQAEMRGWLERLGAVADGLTQRVLEGWQAVLAQAQQMAAQQAQQWQAMQAAQAQELASAARGLGESAGRVCLELNAAQQQQVEHARAVGATLHSDLRAVEQQAREVQRVLSADWKQILDQFLRDMGALRQETGKAQGEVRENLRNVCAALRALVERLEATRPYLEQINQTVGQVQALAQAPAASGKASNGRRWWPFGSKG